MKKLIGFLLFVLASCPAVAQPVQGQLPSGTLWGNSTAARAPAAAATPSAIIDRAISSTQGAVLTRNASGWIGLAPGTAGLPLLSGGAAANVAYGIPALAAGGTGANLTASVGGIFYSGASAGAILSGTATARQMVQSGASAAPAWSTTTWPATTSPGSILVSATANTITDTSTPTLGASGTLGSITFGNATSGLVTVQPVTGALGSVTQLLPAAAGTFAVSATSPIVLGASSGALTCPTCVTSSGGGAITGTAPITVSASGAVSLDAAGVTYAKIQNLGALAVMGRSANTSGVGSDIQATAATDAVLRESGSTIGFGTIATGGIANNAVTLAKLATQATNTVLGNATSGAAVPTALAVASCSTASSALNWTTNTGFGCNSSITAAIAPAGTLTGATLAAGVTASSLTSVGTLTGGTASTGFTINAANVTWSGQIPGASVAVVANASGAPSATFGVMKGDGTTLQCTSGVCSAVGGVATAVTVGTTSVNSGTSTRVLYNNAGVLGEYVITGTGNVAMSASPTFTGTIVAAAATLSGTATFNGTANFASTFQVAGNAMTFPAAAATLTRTIASGAKALATGAIGSAACTAAQTDSATGTATTDAISASFAADPTATTGYIPLTTGMLTIIAYPTTNTVNFKVCNNTGASITPGAITINWRVVR